MTASPSCSPSPTTSSRPTCASSSATANASIWPSLLLFLLLLLLLCSLPLLHSLLPRLSPLTNFTLQTSAPPHALPLPLPLPTLPRPLPLPLPLLPSRQTLARQAQWKSERALSQTSTERTSAQKRLLITQTPTPHLPLYLPLYLHPQLCLLLLQPLQHRNLRLFFHLKAQLQMGSK